MLNGHPWASNNCWWTQWPLGEKISANWLGGGEGYDVLWRTWLNIMRKTFQHRNIILLLVFCLGFLWCWCVVVWRGGICMHALWKAKQVQFQLYEKCHFPWTAEELCLHCCSCIAVSFRSIKDVHNGTNWSFADWCWWLRQWSGAGRWIWSIQWVIDFMLIDRSVCPFLCCSLFASPVCACLCFIYNWTSTCLHA